MEGWKASAVLVGRVLLVLIFLMSGTGKIGNFEGTAQYMAKFGMPLPAFFLFGAIIFEVVGSISILLGYFTRFGAILILFFLIPTTLIFHGQLGDPGQKIQFMKNLSMFGGLLVLLSSGAGRYSLDTLLRERKKRA